MKFVFRQQEINELRRLRWLSEEQYSRTMVLSGAPGIGKTALIRESLSGYKVLFLCASHKSEGLIASDFKREISSKLGIEIASSVKGLPGLFDLIFALAESKTFTLVVDQYHLLSSDNLSCLSSLISEKKRKTNLNLIFVSSDEIASDSIFKNDGSILFNCIDSAVSLKPFSIVELRQILEQSNIGFSLDNLFILYSISGGIPRYVDALISSSDLMSEVYQNGSFFINEGTSLLNAVFGKSSEVYFSILDVISRGAKSQSEIESALGESFNVGGHLAKLESVYGLVRKSRPVFSPENSRGVVRYSITNPFIEFWFKYIEFYRPMIEMGDYDAVINLVKDRLFVDGKAVLERYFREKLLQENNVYEVGAWWSSSSKTAEEALDLPIVAYSKKNKKIVIAEVCISSSEFNKERYLKAVRKFKLSTGCVAPIDTRLFVLEDM